MHPGRMKLPESLRREVILIEPAADLTGCNKIDDEVTEVLEYEPGELYVKQYQMQRFERTGVKLAYSTLTDWVSNTCQLITPLFESLKTEVLQSNYLHADETPIKVLDKKKEGETHRGYYWVYQNSLEKTVFLIIRKDADGKAL